VAPGQSLVNVEVTGEGIFFPDENGNINVDLVTNPPPPISAKQAGCPGANWTATATSVEFLSFEFIVVQNGATLFDNFYNINQ
jgi:hypothetical protein